MTEPPQDRRPIFVKVPSLEALPNSHAVQKTYNHWERQLQSYISAASTVDPSVDKLAILCGFISADVYSLIQDKMTYDDARKHLTDLYKPKKNEVFSRHMLSTRAQQRNENVQEFYQILVELSRDCAFTAVDAENHRKESVRDAFISGLTSSVIRTRLLEQEELTLERALLTATSLEKAREFSTTYDNASARAHNSLSGVSDATHSQNDWPENESLSRLNLSASSVNRNHRKVID